MKFSKSVSALLSVTTLVSSLVTSKSFAAEQAAPSAPVSDWEDDGKPVPPSDSTSAIKVPELSPETRAAITAKMDQANAQLQQSIKTVEAKYAAAKSEDEKQQYSRQAALVLEKYARLALSYDLSVAQQNGEAVAQELEKLQRDGSGSGPLLIVGGGSFVLGSISSLILAKAMISQIANSPSIVFGTAARQLQARSAAVPRPGFFSKTLKAPFRLAGLLTALTAEAALLTWTGTYSVGFIMSAKGYDITWKANDEQIKRIDDELAAIELRRSSVK